MKEKWKSITGYPNYEVSNKGRIRNSRRNSLLRPLLNTQGYLMVMLRNKNSRKRCYIHRLVLITFEGSAPEGKETRHLNDIKTDNQLSNLKWGTKVENWKDRKKYGNNLQGEKNGKAKLEVCDVLTIRKEHKKNKNRKILSQRFSISTNQISRIVSYKSWRHIA